VENFLIFTFVLLFSNFSRKSKEHEFFDRKEGVKKKKEQKEKGI